MSVWITKSPKEYAIKGVGSAPIIELPKTKPWLKTNIGISKRGSFPKATKEAQTTLTPITISAPEKIGVN